MTMRDFVTVYVVAGRLVPRGWYAASSTIGNDAAAYARHKGVKESVWMCCCTGLEACDFIVC